MAVERLSQASIQTLNKYSSMTAGITPPLSDYQLITTQVLGTALASVTFSGLATAAAGFRHLQLRITAQRAITAGNTLSMQLNGDTGTNYTFHRVEATSASATSSSGTGRNNMAVGQVTGTDMQYTAFVCDLLDFTSTTKNKVIRSLTGYATNNIGLYSSAWLNTAAVTAITLYVETGANLSAGSRFSLYGWN